MMYQVRALSGLEIQVRENESTIVNSNGREVYVGSYEACVAWLQERACWPPSQATATRGEVQS